jgi:site-specific DNA-methyltransferase (adenine-specific)
MIAMRTFADNQFDLAIVDPPYGDADGASKFSGRDASRFGGRFDRYGGATRTGGTWAEKYGTSIKHWDVAPDEEYFEELFRVSKNQIIWGSNYFDLPPTRCFVVWRKLTISEKFTMAMAELAWTSFDGNAKVYEIAPQGKADDVRFHPTQKPIELYRRLLRDFANPGDKILDTHSGSGSCAIACAQMGFECAAYEIDEGYWKKSVKRFETLTNQRSLFNE